MAQAFLAFNGDFSLRSCRPKRCKRACHRPLRRTVAAKLRLDWSPAQITDWLKQQYPEDEAYQVSQETIYRSLFIQARGVLKKSLLGDLRSKRAIRRSRGQPERRRPLTNHGRRLDP